MSWIEEESGIKFVQWGKLKKKEDEDVAIVVKQGEHIQGLIERLDEQKDDDGEISQIKYRLKVKGVEEPVILWSNASIIRQHKNLELKEGEEVRFTYVKDYPTQAGNKGREIKVAVNR